MKDAYIENNLILNLKFSKVIRMNEYIVKVFPDMNEFLRSTRKLLLGSGFILQLDNQANLSPQK